MKALLIKGYGDIESNLSFEDIKKPTCGKKQILVEIYSAGVNPIDYKIIEGQLKALQKLKFPAQIGFDVAGVVIEKGDEVNNFNIGDKVYSRVSGDEPGTFAEFIAIDCNLASHMPNNLSFNEASSLPLVALTTIQSFEKAELKANNKILIHAGSGGIGTFAIQYAKSKGAFVYTTTSTNNVEWVRELGADVVIDYKKDNYEDIVKDIDVVYDTLGGKYTTNAFNIIKEGGKVISIAGDIDKETSIELGLNTFVRFLLSLKRMKITKLITKKSAYYKFILMNPSGSQLNDLKLLIEENKIKAIIDKSFSFPESIKALIYLKKGRAKGKVVIQLKK
jgi:hypothetical protein